jgi:hypothetical protein
MQQIENRMIISEWIKDKTLRGEYYYSKHGDLERQNDNLTFMEIEKAIINGRIIEQYDDAVRGKSCLMAGFSDEGKPIHVVIGERGDCPVIITVYIPTPPKFKSLYERG